MCKEREKVRLFRDSIQVANTVINDLTTQGYVFEIDVLDVSTVGHLNNVYIRTRVLKEIGE